MGAHANSHVYIHQKGSKSMHIQTKENTTFIHTPQLFKHVKSHPFKYPYIFAIKLFKAFFQFFF